MAQVSEELQHLIGENEPIDLDDDEDSGDEDSGDEEDDRDDDDDEEEVDGDYVPPWLLPNANSNSTSQEVGGEGRKRLEEGNGEIIERKEAICSDEDWNGGDIDGLLCPICMEAWADAGDHQICCLPCGHIYGMSCIKRWLKPHGRKNSDKCPQCNLKCTLKDIRILYASRLITVDARLQKKLRPLEAKCTSLEKKDAGWSKKEDEWHKREENLHLEVNRLLKRTTYLEHLLEEMQSRSSESVDADGGCPQRVASARNLGSTLDRRGRACNFSLKKELRVEGARVFDVDTSRNILVISRSYPGINGKHVLTKMSLIPPYEREDIPLPCSIKSVKDLSISSNDSLALLATLGKKLSVLSMESNNIVHTYDLPAAAWSCSWDSSCSNYMYAGLQNGMLLMFDIRQTAKPVESMTGLQVHPVHTVYSLPLDTTLPRGFRSVLSASAGGLCHWNFCCSEERPFLVPETENQGICISLAYSLRSDDVVASFRPKVESNGVATSTQPPLTPVPDSSSLLRVVPGFHKAFKRTGGIYHKLGSSCANVDSVRLSKSMIVDREGCNPLFASADELTSDLVMQELPSFEVVQRLKSPRPIRNVKWIEPKDLGSWSPGLLCCLSADMLQLFAHNSP